MDEMPIILLVEDEPALQEFVRDALGEAGYELTAFESAEKALEFLQNGSPHYRALVTDIQVKGQMTGWDLARKVRETNPACPVVYMTGAAADQWPSQGVPDSILLQKPFAPAQLVTAVSQLLNAQSPSSHDNGH
jgi:CheY-like chemotaxis protein